MNLKPTSVCLDHSTSVALTKSGEASIPILLGFGVEEAVRLPIYIREEVLGNLEMCQQPWCKLLAFRINILVQEPVGRLAVRLQVKRITKYRYCSLCFPRLWCNHQTMTKHDAAEAVTCIHWSIRWVSAIQPCVAAQCSVKLQSP